MKLVWHILRKDLWHVRFHLLLLAMTGLTVYYVALRMAPLGQAWQNWDASLLFFAYLALWLSLIPAMLQTDPATGTVDLWMTRPVSAETVYAAKLIGGLFAFALMAGGHALFLLSQGFNVGQIVAFLESFAPPFAGIFLFAFLIAALTRNVGFFWFLLLAIPTGCVLTMGVFSRVAPRLIQEPSDELGETREALSFFLILGGSLLLSWWQYRHRRMPRGWISAGLLVVSAMLLEQFWPWRVGHPVKPPSREVSWIVQVVQEQPPASDSATTIPPLMIQIVPPSGSVARVDAIYGRTTWSDGSTMEAEGVAKTHAGRLAAVEAELGAGYVVAEAGQAEEIPNSVSLGPSPEFMGTKDLRPARLDVTITGVQVRYIYLGKTELAKGASIVREGHKLQVLEAPSDNRAHHLTVKYQSPHYPRLNYGFRRPPLLALINPVRKEARVLPSMGQLGRIKAGIPGLDLSMESWKILADTEAPIGSVSVDDAWLAEAELWVFGGVYEGIVRQSFSSVLQERNGHLRWVTVEPVKPPPRPPRGRSIMRERDSQTEPRP